MTASKRLIIPVSDEIHVDRLFIERYCAQAGWIVANVAEATPETSIRVGNERIWNGDCGINFWIADVIASELTTQFDHAPLIDLPLDEACSPEMQKGLEIFRKILEEDE